MHGRHKEQKCTHDVYKAEGCVTFLQEQWQFIDT